MEWWNILSFWYEEKRASWSSSSSFASFIIELGKFSFHYVETCGWILFSLSVSRLSLHFLIISSFCFIFPTDSHRHRLLRAGLPQFNHVLMCLQSFIWNWMVSTNFVGRVREVTAIFSDDEVGKDSFSCVKEGTEAFLRTPLKSWNERHYTFSSPNNVSQQTLDLLYCSLKCPSFWPVASIGRFSVFFEIFTSCLNWCIHQCKCYV